MPATITHTFSAVPIDVILIVLFAVLMIIFSLRAGERLAVALSLALPVAYILQNFIKSAAFASAFALRLNDPLIGLAFVVGLCLVSFFIVFSILGFGFSASARPLPALLSGAAATILLIVFLDKMLLGNAFWHLSSHTAALFGPAYALWWVLASYVALLIARRS